MTEEIQEKTTEEKLAEDEVIIQNIQFFSDPIRFNNVLYQGVKSILENQKFIIGKINLIEEKLKKEDGNIQ